jgi:hypothetical protein
MNDLEFVAIAESGILESQALLLCQSIRLFSGSFSKCRISVISPRSDRRPSRRFLKTIEKLAVRYVPMETDSPCPEYGPSMRVFALAQFEKQAQAESMVFLDSDTIFIREPRLELGMASAGVRPVDVKGMCTCGPEDPKDAYWRQLCRICEVDYARVPYVTTTVDLCRVKASYNGGLQVVRKTAGIWQRTADFFLRSVRADLRPWKGSGLDVRSGSGQVGIAGSEFWGSSQACLSLAFWSADIAIMTLEPTLNFPLHLLESMPKDQRETSLDKLSHLHYHHLLSSPVENGPIFGGRIPLPEAVAHLLERIVPQGRGRWHFV